MKEGIIMAITNNLKEIRSKRRVTQHDLAVATDTCTRTIRNIGRNENCCSVEMALRMAAYLNASVEMLFTLTSEDFVEEQ